MWLHTKMGMAKLVICALIVVLLVPGAASASTDRATCQGHDVTMYAEDVLSYELPDVDELVAAYMASQDRSTVLNALYAARRAGRYQEALERVHVGFRQSANRSGERFDGAIVLGTPGDDVILGTDSGDWILGFGGNDVICGLKGDDFLAGGFGVDRLRGGAGRDSLDSGDEADPREVLNGGSGRDTLVVQIRDCDQIVQQTDAVIGGSELLVTSYGCTTTDGNGNVVVYARGSGSNIWWA